MALDRPDKGQSGWTVDVLKEHFETLREHDLKHAEELREEQQRAVERLAATYAADKAAANEWRGTINDLLSVMKGSKSGIREFVGWIAFAITLVLGILGVFIVKLKP